MSHFNQMKLCRKCYTRKPISCFYKHPDMIDGYLNICKECTKKRIREYRRRHPEITRRISKKKYEKAKLAPGFREAQRERLKKWRTPEKQKAHNITHRKLRRPNYCKICGAACKPVGHHPDYNKPAHVIWCCDLCHARIHSEQGL